MNLPTIAVVDAETSGIDVARDDILEFAVILCDDELNEIDSMERLVAPSAYALQRMSDEPFVMEMHEASGLLDDLSGTDVMTPQALDLTLMAWLAEHGISDEKLVLAGSGVARFDGHLLRRQLPRFAGALDYFEYDVSSLRRLWRLATGTDLTPVNTTKPHRAMADARIHLTELRMFALVLRAAGESLADAILSSDEEG